jgi:hypothetical protein
MIQDVLPTSLPCCGGGTAFMESDFGSASAISRNAGALAVVFGAVSLA